MSQFKKMPNAFEGLRTGRRGSVMVSPIIGQEYEADKVDTITALRSKVAELELRLKQRAAGFAVNEAAHKRIDELTIENRALQAELALTNQLLVECKDQLQKNITILTEVREQLAVKAL
jgi:hypothetical protein